MIFLRHKNALANYNAGVVVVNSKFVGVAPGFVTRDRRIGSRGQFFKTRVGANYSMGAILRRRENLFKKLAPGF
jgi:hypothetical protein